MELFGEEDSVERGLIREGGLLERISKDANIYLLSTLQITYLAVTQFLGTYYKRKKIAIHFG